MADLSIWTGVGRLTRDAELRYTNAGEPMLKFSLASGTRVKKGDAWVDEPTFREVILLGKRGESLARYMTKGKQVGVTGPEREERWEHEGKQYHKLTVNASEVHFVGGGQRQESSQQQAPAGGQAPQTAGDAPGDFGDDIPFD